MKKQLTERLQQLAGIKPLYELEEKRKENKPNSMKEMKKPTKELLERVKKEMFSGTVEESLDNYTKMYNACPEWAQAEALSPDEVKSKMDEEGDDEPAALIWTIVHILCWVIVAWYFWPF